jgi:hypothetical protein
VSDRAAHAGHANHTRHACVLSRSLQQTLTIGCAFKVIEWAVQDMLKKEALKDENLHIMNACFGPELAKKVQKQHNGTGTSHPKGNAKRSHGR